MGVKKHQNFESLLGEHPASRVVYDDAGALRSLSYAELADKAASFLVPAVSSVGLLATGAIDDLLAIFALAKAKKRIVLLDPLEESSRLAEQIQATHIQALMGPKELTDSLSPYLSKETTDENDDILFFTSGTTSSNKAVRLSEASLCASAYNGASLLPLGEEDNLLSILPWNHVYGFVCAVLWPLECGATLSLGRGARHFFDDLAHFKPTALSLVPQMAAFFLSKNLFNPELKTVLIGAGSCPNEVLSGIKAKGIRVSYGYGLTETSSGVALSLGDDPNAMTFCPEVDIKIAPDGEVLLKAPTVEMRGYYDDEEKTRGSYDDEGYLKTGDLGSLTPEGLLVLKGRKKEILVFDDGTKLFLPEYEGSLMKALGVNGLAVLKGEEGLVAVLEKGVDKLDEKIAAFNEAQRPSARIAAYKVLGVPLPRTRTGKIKRYAIKIR